MGSTTLGEWPRAGWLMYSSNDGTGLYGDTEKGEEANL